MRDGDEYDALTKWKNYLHWRAGERKTIKRRFNKRQRQHTRLSLTHVLATSRQTVLC